VIHRDRGGEDEDEGEKPQNWKEAE